MTTNHKTALITGVTGQDGAYLAGLDIGAIRRDLLQLFCAGTCSHLYTLPTIGMRFLAVYSLLGRPDMVLFNFTKAILAGEPIQVFNYGKHRRDFTYVDDIVEGVDRTHDKPAPSNPDSSGDRRDPDTSLAPWHVYNIGNCNSVEQMDYIAAVEKALGRAVEIEMLPLREGDVPDTYADVKDLVEYIDYKHMTTVEEGIGQIVAWYRTCYQV